MHRRVNWGGGTKWKWNNALNLCQGSTRAANTVSCFRKQISAKQPWPKAIKTCQATNLNRLVVRDHRSIRTSAVPRPATVNTKACANSIQGKIAWDYKGSKSWAKNNLTRLCKGAGSSKQPGICFNTVMHRGVNWGGGTKWKWKNALNLCEGSRHASKTVSCFKGMISKKKPWATAINKCKG